LSVCFKRESLAALDAADNSRDEYFARSIGGAGYSPGDKFVFDRVWSGTANLMSAGPSISGEG